MSKLPEWSIQRADSTPDTNGVLWNASPHMTKLTELCRNLVAQLLDLSPMEVFKRWRGRGAQGNQELRLPPLPGITPEQRTVLPTPVTTTPPEESRTNKSALVVSIVPKSGQESNVKIFTPETITRDALRLISLTICNQIHQASTMEQVAVCITEDLLRLIREFELSEAHSLKLSYFRLVWTSNDVSVIFAVDAKRILDHYPHVFFQLESFADKEKELRAAGKKPPKARLVGLNHGELIRNVSWQHYGMSQKLSLDGSPLLQIIVEAGMGGDYMKTLSWSTDGTTYRILVEQIFSKIIDTAFDRLQRIEQEQQWLQQEYRSNEVSKTDPRTIAGTEEDRQVYQSSLHKNSIPYREYTIFISHYTDAGENIQREVIKQILFALSRVNSDRLFINADGDVSFFVLSGEEGAWEAISEFFAELNEELQQLQIRIE